MVPTPHNSKREDEDEDYDKIKVNHETEERRRGDHQPKDTMGVHAHAHAIVRRTWLTPWEKAGVSECGKRRRSQKETPKI